MFAWLVPLVATAATLDRATVPATGSQTVGLRVDTFGRYALIADGPQGTALQLVDRMTGATPVRGRPGHEDGRLDTFLEAGDYRVVAMSDPQGTGTATLKAVAFTEVGGTETLTEGARARSTLQDRQQRSWWVVTEAQRPVAIEAVGRHLADLRVWTDDGWMRPELPDCATWEPEPGRPLTRCTLVADLPAGIWQLALYGGPSADWSVPGSDAGVSVQYGFASVPNAGRHVRALPETGLERLLVPEGIDTFRLSLPERKPAAIAARPYDPADPYLGGGSTGGIDDESRVPEARVYVDGSDLPTLVTITGRPGQVYTLDALPAIGEATSIDGNGRYLVTTVHAANPLDVADPTGLLVRYTQDAAITGPTAAIRVGRGARWARRFDLFEPTKILLETGAETLSVKVGGTRARFRIEPFLVSRPKDYQEPPWSEREQQVALPAGLHVLTLEPIEPGIVEVDIGQGAATPTRPNLQWMDVALDRSAPFTLQRPLQPGVPTGLVVRELPLDPALPVPLSALPGEELALPVRLSSDGILEALDTAGQPLEVALDGGWGPSVAATAGDHTLRIRNPRASVAQLVVRQRPEAPEPLPVPFVGPTMPRPSLKAGEPLALDLEAGEQAELEVEVARDGLYVVETTGLLATSGRIRTRTRTSLAEADRNGLGRNARLVQYLRRGTYLVHVQTEEGSAGHLAVALREAERRDGGNLREGAPARVTLPANTSMTYRFTTEAGDWRLRSFGLGETLSCRLEDLDGWPLGPAEQACDAVVALPAGEFRVVLSPRPLETRRTTTLDSLRPEVARTGHGPHALPLDAPVRHVWREGDDRPADVWTFDLPAAARVTFTLSPEMRGEVLGAAGPAGSIEPGRPFSADLAAGPWRVEVRAARPNDRVTYTLEAAPDLLVAGVTRWVSAPGSYRVGVGAAGVVELASFGGIDVRARLRDASGALIASDDDRPDDWNFQLSERLTPGVYTLELTAPGGDGGEVAVRVATPAERGGEPLAPGVPAALRLGDDVLVLPVARGAHPVVVASAKGGETVELVLEVDDGGWRPVAGGTGAQPVVAAHVGDRPVRLRVRSLDGRGSDTSVVVHEPNPGNGALKRGDAPLGVAKVADGAGLVRLEGGSDLLHCPDALGACVPVAGEVVAAPEGGLYVLGRAGKVRGERIVLDGERPVRTGVPAGLDRTVDLAGRGPVAVVVRASAGTPGVALGEARDGWAPGEGAALAFSSSGARSARFWSADGEALDATVRSLHLGDAELATIGLVAEVQVGAGEARRLVLPAGAAAIAAALEPGLALVTGAGAAWADRRARQVELPAQGEAWLLNVGDAPARAALEVTTAAPVDLAAGSLEVVPTRAGAVLAKVPAGALHVRGGEATLLQADGAVRRGSDLTTDTGGIAWIAHGVGPLVAWSGEAPLVADDGPRRRVEGAATVPLSGASVHLDVVGDGPSLVQVRLPCPAIVEAATGTEVLPNGGSWTTWLPEGHGPVSVRALHGSALFGDAAVSATPAATLGEGLGPEVLLPAGGARAFTFETARAGSVGLGIRADADRVTATLRDPTGRVVARGASALVDLPAGAWVLVLEQPEDAAPVAVRPSVVGLAPPGDGPPPSVVKTYVSEGGER